MNVVISVDEARAKLIRLRNLVAAEREKRESVIAAREAEGHQSRQVYVDRPVDYVHDQLLGFTWSKQQAILQSIVDNRLTAVPACHGPGKSRTAGNAAAWWIDCHPPGTAFVVTIAPTHHQVKSILWREMGAIHRQGQLPGRMNRTEWYINDQLVAFGRAPEDGTAVQGIHARYVLVIIDEACGIDQEIWDAVSSLASNDESRILAIGNPDDPATPFREACQPGSGWNVISISAFDTPNFTNEEVPDWLRHLLIGRTWVAEKTKQWGTDDPRYQAKVLGRFPELVQGALWSPKVIRDCRVADLPEGVHLVRAVVAVDPSGVTEADRKKGKGEGGDAQGIIVAGLGSDGHGYVLEDGTVKLDPEGWGQQAVDLFHFWQADVIVAEKNFGGGMVETVIRVADRLVPVKLVTASRGKMVRAEPIASVYRQGLIHHVFDEEAANKVIAKTGQTLGDLNPFDDLEQEMLLCSNTGYRGKNSPNRLDAMVWAITELMLENDQVNTAVEMSMLTEEPRKVPSHWLRASAMDLDRSRFGAVWVAIDPETNVLHFYGEALQKRGNLAAHGKTLRDKGPWVPSILDPDARDRKPVEAKQVLDQMVDLDVNVFTVPYEPDAGLDAWAAMVSAGRVKVATTLTHLLKSIREARRGNDGEVVERDDHLMRCAGMLCLYASDIASTEMPDDDEDLWADETRSGTTGY